MIAFWIAAALLTGAAAGLIVHRAARAEARAAGAEDPSLAVYRRQLLELEDLTAGGLLPAGELRSARAEAARRLLAASDAPAEPQAAGLSSDRSRWLVLITAALAPLLAVAVYLGVGSPQTPDQPFAKRVAAWRNADPQTLDAPRMVAVLSAMA